jgi:simple sugar transport system ATP-binding protein
LKETGISTLFVSHKFNEVFEISENITVLRDGRMIGTYPTSEMDSDRLSNVMTGRKVKSAPFTYDASQRGGAPLISLKDLGRSGEFQGINLDLHKGEILGIVGLIGSGRTEIAQTLFGLRTPETGQILLNGKPTRIRTPQDAIANGIALLPEDRMHEGLFEALPIFDNIIVTILKSLLTRTGLLDPEKRRHAGTRWLERLNIKTPSGHAPVNSLSGGNQQRVVLAKWLATEPEIFILDGPTIGVDVGSKSKIHTIIQDLAAKGMGIIMISDETQELLVNCNRLIVLHRGRIVAEIDDPSAHAPEQLFDLISQQDTLGDAA